MAKHPGGHIPTRRNTVGLPVLRPTRPGRGRGVARRAVVVSRKKK